MQGEREGVGEEVQRHRWGLQRGCRETQNGLGGIQNRQEKGIRERESYITNTMAERGSMWRGGDYNMTGYQ